MSYAGFVLCLCGLVGDSPALLFFGLLVMGLEDF